MAGDRPVAATRHEARERALHLLYEAEARDLLPAGALDDQILAPDPFTTRLVAGVGAHIDVIDQMISDRAQGWALERMPAMDRAILRLATFELQFDADTPTAVIIDEAVELAKEYSTEDSGRFVNGVLAAIAAIVRAPGPQS